MSFGGGGGAIASAFVEVMADTARADRAIDDLVSRLAGLEPTVTVQAETDAVTAATEQAVADAETEAEVTGDAAEVTSATEDAVDDADTDVEVTGDASEVTDSIDGAVSAAETDVDVTGDASEVTEAVDNAVSAADTAVDVTGDAGDVTQAIDGAVDAADTTVDVTGDAGGITSSIDSAVDAADTTVEVDGTADGLTDQITSAVDAADTFVQVDGDASGLTDSLGEADSAADDLNVSLLDVGGTLGALSAVILSGTIAASVLDAQRLNSAVANTETIIRATEGAARLSTQQIQAMADALQFEVGVDATEIIEAQNILLTFRNVSGDVFREATGLAFDMAAVLGQDASAGAIQLGKALNDPVKGVTALARVGVTFTEQQKQQITTMVEAGDVVAAQGVILDELSSQLGGAAEASADTTAKFTIAGRNIAREFGGPLIAIIDDYGPRVIDTIMSFGPAAANLGDEIAPVLGTLLNLFVELAPTAITFIDVLAAGVPIIDAAASAIDAIPTPLLSMLVSLATLRSAVRLFHGPLGGLATAVGNLAFPLGTTSGAFNVAGASASRAGFGVLTFRSAVSGIGAVLTPANVALIGLAAAFAVWNQRQQESKQRAAELEETVRTVTEAVREADDVVEGLGSGLERASATGEEASNRLTDVADALGISTEQLIGMVAGSDDAAGSIARFAQETGRTSELLGAFDVSASQGETAADELRGALDDLTEGLVEDAVANGELTSAQAEQILASENQFAAFVRITEATRRATEARSATIDSQARQLQAQGLLTESQARQIRSTEDLAEKEQSFARAIEERVDLVGLATELQDRYASAVGHTADQNRAFGLTLEALHEPANSTTTFLAQFTQLASSGAIATEDLEAAAAALGVPMEDLQFLMDGVNERMQTFIDGAVGNLPSVSQIASQVDEEFSLRGIRDQLALSLEAAQSFTENLQFLVEQGLGGAAAFAAQAGPDVAEALVSGFREGDRGVVEQINLLTAGVEQQVGIQLPQTINGLAPGVASQMGVVGALSSQAFGGAFQPQPIALSQLQGTIVEMQSQGGFFGVVGGILADRFITPFGAGMGRMPTVAGNESRAALENARSFAHQFGITGGILGERTTSGFDNAIGRMPGSASRNTRTAMENARSFANQFGITGGILGERTTSGFDNAIGRMPRAAGRNTRDAMDRARSFASQFGITGGILGDRQVGGYNRTAAGMSGRAANQARSTRDRLAGFGGAFASAGRGLGTSSVAGIRSGMASESAPSRFDPFIRRNIKANVEGAFKRVFGIFSPARTMIPIGQNILRGVMVGIANETGSLDKMVRGMQNLLAGAFGDLGFKGGPGVERWRGLALQALRMTGSPLSWIGSLLRRMDQESGGNPNAINLTDINAQRGDPSMGLMQNIPSAYQSRVAAFPSLRGTSPFDPLGSIVASIVYANQRYGIAPRGWDRPGGYQQGTGFVPRDDVFRLHRGESVFPADVTSFLRREGFPLQTNVADPATTVTIEGDFVINVPAGTPNPTIYGSRVAKGFTRTLRERQIRVDARIS